MGKETHNLGSNPPLPQTGWQTLDKSHNLPHPGFLDEKMLSVVLAVVLNLPVRPGSLEVNPGVKQDEQFWYYILDFNRISLELMVLRL